MTNLVLQNKNFPFGDSISSNSYGHRRVDYNKALLLNDDKITILNKIGTGRFSFVMKGFLKTDRTTIALKYSNSPTHSATELEALSRISEYRNQLSEKQFGFIIEFFGVFLDNESSVFFIFNYMSEGSLLQMIQRGYIFDEHQLSAIACSVLNALEVLDDCGIVHCDITPANILCNREGQVKVSDFGSANILPYPGAQTQNRTGVLQGSLSYMAPERLLRESFGSATDLWSLGVTLLHLDSRDYPFGTANTFWLLRSAVFAIADTLPSTGKIATFSVPFQELLRTLLSRIPSNRSNACKLLKEYNFQNSKLVISKQL